MNDITEVLLFHNVQIASNLLGFVQICLTCIVLFFFLMASIAVLLQSAKCYLCYGTGKGLLRPQTQVAVFNPLNH